MTNMPTSNATAANASSDSRVDCAAASASSRCSAASSSPVCTLRSGAVITRRTASTAPDAPAVVRSSNRSYVSPSRAGASAAAKATSGADSTPRVRYSKMPATVARTSRPPARMTLASSPGARPDSVAAAADSATSPAAGARPAVRLKRPVSSQPVPARAWLPEMILPFSPTSDAGAAWTAVTFSTPGISARRRASSSVSAGWDAGPRTATSTSDLVAVAVNDAAVESEITHVATTKATPRTIATRVIAIRPLCARRSRSIARSIRPPPFPGASCGPGRCPPSARRARRPACRRRGTARGPRRPRPRVRG